ncbi:hypothetical protein GCM10010264_65460 [Streptomyces globisporus]|nr:hypothetical protein GCM10010264_65460 [Streptomyces globisporus]
MRWKSGPGGRRSGPEGPVLADNAWLLSGWGFSSHCVEGFGPLPRTGAFPVLPTVGPAVHELYSGVDGRFRGGFRDENRTPMGISREGTDTP